MRLGRGFKPEDVFTPRSSKVNPLLYIRRKDLEAQLLNGILGTKHVIVHGESGNGKSWLYKKVFEDNRIKFTVVNLANASRLGSLNAAFENKVERLEAEIEEGRSTTKSLDFAPGGVGPKGQSEKSYRKAIKEPFERILEKFKGSKKKPSVIVLDNFEQVLGNDSIIKEISDTIVLLDDDDYSQYFVKICIVGVPADIREYLSRQGQIATISSRLFEVEEVARMRPTEARALLEVGLEELLNIKFADGVSSDEVYESILFLSDRIAVELQEIGLFIAQKAYEDGLVIEEDSVDEAIGSWITHSHTAVKQAVEDRLNSRETFPGRRNQCIYCLGLIESEEFRYSDVEAILRSEFPLTTSGTSLNVAGMLTELAAGKNPPIKRVPKGDAYRFSNPKYRMAIRTVLKKLDSERVVKNVRQI